MITNSLGRSNHRNLVIVRAGDHSLHPGWLGDENQRHWDIVVNYYGDQENLYCESHVQRIDSKGPKWPALHLLLQENPNFLNMYDYIWLPDDDLSTTMSEINNLFSVMYEYKLQIAQPSLEQSSYFSHLLTIHNDNFQLRFTNFVEIMAPCFATELLTKAMPFLNAGLSGWGLDFIWQKLVDVPENQIAIIDDVQVRHTRPVGGPNYKTLQERGISPWDEFLTICKLASIDENPTIRTLWGIMRDGKILDARKKPNIFTLKLLSGYLKALLHTPQPIEFLDNMRGTLWRSLSKQPHRVNVKSKPRKITQPKQP